MLEPHIAPPACITVTQLDKGNSFRALHQGTRAFVIPNAWDAGSARVLAGLGFAAIATSGEATGRVAAAVAATRKLGFPFMLTARAEGFRYGNTDLDDAIKRLQAYEKAGADVLMAPGLPDLASVKAVCAAIAKPFNFMAGIPGMSFPVAELEAAGVRRISLAGSLYRAATSGLVAAARELKDKGSFGYVDTSLPSAEVAGFMRG